MSIADEIIHSENVYSGRPADSFHSLDTLVIVKTAWCLRLDSVTGWVWHRFVEYNFIILLHEQTLEKTDGSIKNGQCRDRQHWTQDNRPKTNKAKYTIQKTKDVQHGNTELSNYEKVPVPFYFLYIYCTIVVIL